MGMDCHECREIVSARLDGEDRPGEWDAARSHLAGCAACRRFAAAGEELRRTTRVVPAEPVPDLTAAVLAAVGDASAGPAGRAGPTGSSDLPRTLRRVLVFVAVVQIAIAVPAVVAGDPASGSDHLARHLGAFDIALAVGFLLVASRPARFLTGTFPVVLAAVVGVIAVSAIDLVSGRGAGGTEIAHVTDVAGVLAMWLLGRTSARPVLA